MISLSNLSYIYSTFHSIRGSSRRILEIQHFFIKKTTFLLCYLRLETSQTINSHITVSVRSNHHFHIFTWTIVIFSTSFFLLLSSILIVCRLYTSSPFILLSPGDSSTFLASFLLYLQPFQRILCNFNLPCISIYRNCMKSTI